MVSGSSGVEKVPLVNAPGSPAVPTLPELCAKPVAV